MILAGFAPAQDVPSAIDRDEDARSFVRYLREKYSAKIESVSVGVEKIRITGSSAVPVGLVELAPHVPSHGDSELPRVAIESHKKFSIEVPRFDSVSKRDRALSRWRLASSDGAVASLARWPDKVAPGIANDLLKKLSSKSQKGIGGVPNLRRDNHPIFELGVSHATVNIVLNACVSTSGGPGRKTFEFEGKNFFLKESYLARTEETVGRLCRRGIIVSGILLAQNDRGALLTHPEAEARGTYAMPNLATEDGARLYRATLEVLANRFSQPGARIANWIIHNEVDQAATWTNMGGQPLARYLESYARSARLVYHTARLHDPHARVFISLTHHWARKSPGLGTYPAREMLDLWTELARAEGEFGWGVAYHPYPRDLRNPDTWRDSEVTFDFDTPYITPKNFEVLPAYLGPDRPILFSEQGFNTPTLSEADQKRQLAGIIYTFRKLRHMPSVEAFHLHRFQDMPKQEGGLRLGIMDEKGNRKLAWDAYAAIGSGAEAPSKYATIADELLPKTGEEPLHKIALRPKPNIVLVVADDLGWSDTTPYLDPKEDFYETPALAKLALRGMLFTNAYAASPLCSPTRASILTGQYPGRIRLTTPACHVEKVVLDPQLKKSAPPSRHAIEPDTRTRFPNSYVTIAEVLKKAEYATAFAGKWHLGRDPYLPDNQGFDRVIGGRHHPGPPGGYFAPWPIDTVPKSPAGAHIDDVITDESIAWLEKQKASGKPFFLNLWYYSVHAPFQAKSDLIEKYRKKAKGLPPGAPRRNPVMAAMIETMDSNVGRIADTLDRLGLSENTLLVFTSDNGGNEYNYIENLPATNNHPLLNGKGNIADGGQRVPFIAVWPGKIKAGVVRSDLISSIDLFPTFLEATGMQPVPAQAVDGRSLLPGLLGKEKADPERAIFCHFPHSPPATGTVAATSVRRGPWKLTRFFADGPGQKDRLRLIDVESDPGESKDLSREKPALTRELNGLITSHLEETRSLVPIPNPDYRKSMLGWKGNKYVRLKRDSNGLFVESVGGDPWIHATDFGRASGKISVEIEMQRGEIASPAVLYWGTRKQKKFHRDRSKQFRRRAGDMVFRADIDLKGEVLDAIRIDPAQEPGKMAIKRIRLIVWTGPGAGKTVRLWEF